MGRVPLSFRWRYHRIKAHQPANWTDAIRFVVKKKVDRLAVELNGALDEGSIPVLVELAKKLSARVSFDCRGISSINSLGIAGWFQFLESLGERVTYDFESASVAFVQAVNMFPAAVCRGRITSLVVSSTCRPCRTRSEAVYPAADVRKNGYPVPSCPRCRKVMTPDFDLIEHTEFLGEV